MIIRPAEEKDKGAIIELLKSSLGESMIPKSAELWNWKHEQNPFGKSFVLLAEEDGFIIGVRAFMQWTWQWGDKSYQAIRAVDTATHPGHQGKGIFKKLTLQQLEICRHQGIDFVFNTPNDQSRPGYLKMGWQQQGKLPLKLKVVNPIAAGLRYILKKPAQHTHFTAALASEWKAALDAFTGKNPLPIQGIHTKISAEYLQWRYTANPLFPYRFVTDEKNYLLVYRMKPQKYHSELRITDFILYNDAVNVASDLKAKMKKVIMELKPDVVSVSGNPYLHYRNNFKWMGLLPVKPLGPIVTLRSVNSKVDFDALMQSNNWQYSLGDLELF